jgi:hypothetical protein
MFLDGLRQINLRGCVLRRTDGSKRQYHCESKPVRRSNT